MSPRPERPRRGAARPAASSGAERLQKILARAGVSSRRAAETLVVEGRVTVNGRVVRELGAKADPARDDVRLDGEPVRAARTSWWAVHKPVGVVTTMRDPEGRPTIRDLLPKEAGRLFPVGRLDVSSSGLLLATNDGEVAERLLHPSTGVERTYRVKVHGHPDEKQLGRLRRGVRLEDGKTGPAEVTVESTLPSKAWLLVTIREGRRREIRRMCEAVGLLVDKLARVRFGPVRLGRLRPGDARPLRTEEIDELRTAAGLGPDRGRARPPRGRSRPRPR